MATAKAFIYALTDPRSGSIRYVGMTTMLTHRPFAHSSDANASERKRAWFQELAMAGLEASVSLLDTVAFDERFDREREWIERLTKGGADLLNIVHNKPPNAATSRIIVDVDPNFHKRVRQAALDRDVTIKELVISCVERCIEDKLPPQKQRPSPAPPAPGSGVKREE